MDLCEENPNTETAIEHEQFQDLCASNGISYTRLEEEKEYVRQLEMFFTGFSIISGLHHFPNLQKLVIMHQSINRIEGLETLVLLEELWICECNITNIENLNHCEMLTKLYLYCNNIAKIANLDKLIDLQILWLNGNKISEIENLSSLKNLTELNLAENQISKIGEGLNNNNCLENLNLSRNKIMFLKDVKDLCSLSTLKHLSFKDPHYGACPVAQLSNYSSYVLFYLPHLISLDTYNVSSKEIFEIIESLVEKKGVFYNDRMKNLDYQKSCWSVAANQLKEYMLSKYREGMKRLAKAIRKIKSICLSEIVKNMSISPDSDKESETSSKETKIQESNYLNPLKALNRFQKVYAKYESYYASIEKEYCLAVDYVEKRHRRLVDYLQLEMGTCGNIRVQQCSVDDPCYDSCCNVVLSKFCPNDYWTLNVIGTEVQNIYKIVNAATIARFENQMMSLIPNSYDDFSFVNKVNDLKKKQDYLYWVYNPELPPAMSDMEMIIENGFPASNSYQKLGMNTAIPLANSLFLADRWRIKQELLSTNQNTESFAFKYGMLLMCRVYLGKSNEIMNNNSIHTQSCNNVQSVFKTKATLYQLSEIPEDLDKHYACDCLKDHQEWYIFNPEYIVPEYVIEFKYITMPTNENPFLKVEKGQNVNEFEDLLAACECALGKQADDDSVEKMIEQFENQTRSWQHKDANVMAIIHKTPIPELITQLNLSHQNLKNLEALTAVCSLNRLDVSFNQLTHVSLNTIPLKYLDASFNKICSLKGMKNLTSLKYCDISWNKLTNLKAEIHVLKVHAKFVEELDTRQNPWRKPEDCRLRIIDQLHNVSMLDGYPILESERDAAENLLTTDLISASLLETHSYLDLTEPHVLSLWNTAQTFTCTSLNTPGKLSETDQTCFSKIISANLDQCQLSDLTYLRRLYKLKWISLNRNQLTTLKDLGYCCELEEISASDNCIERIGDLSQLIHLQRLHLGHNFITTLKGCGLAYLTQLTYLSLENNFIQNLNGFQELSSLCSLYINHNQISYSREIILLKNLKQLMVVDFRSNPMTTENENYRSYVIFHLKGIQVLDGESVDPAEIIVAKDLFGGRLTPDFINERLGKFTNQELKELNFPNCNLRTVDLGNSNAYGNLTSINLEHNNLTSLDGFLYLHHLKVLCLNNNRIESILTRHKCGKQKANPALGDSEDSNEGEMDAGTNRILLKLEVLHLGYNEIKNLAPFQFNRLPSLKALFLQGNEISKLEGLDGLSSLVELVLDANRVKTILPSTFSGLSNLTELHLEENRLISLAGFEDLPKLKRLYLGSNKIQDISEFEHLASLNSLIDISLINNPVSKKAQMRYILISNFPQLTVINNTVITEEDCIKAESFITDQLRQSNSTTNQAIVLEGGLPCITQCNLQVTSVKPTTITLCSPAIGMTSNTTTAQDCLYAHQVEKSTKHSISGNRHQSVGVPVLPNVTLSKNGPVTISDHPPEPSYATLQEFGDSLLKIKDHSTGNH